MFVAGFIGSPQMNFLDAIFEKNSEGYLTLWVRKLIFYKKMVDF